MIRSILYILFGCVFVIGGAFGGILINKSLDKRRRKLSLRIFGCILVICSVFGGILINKGIENAMKQSVISKLDNYSLDVLRTTDGISFIKVDPYTPETIVASIRHLINLGLLKLEIYPSGTKYYLSDEGRLFLTNNLHKRLYPKIFCDLIITRYWKGYPRDFLLKKEEFRKKYKISWDECWSIFIKLIEKEESGAEDNFVSYFDKNSFDANMEKIVKPWENQIKIRHGR